MDETDRFIQNMKQLSTPQEAPRTYLGRPTMMSAKSTSTKAMRAKKKRERANKRKGRK